MGWLVLLPLLVPLITAGLCVLLWRRRRWQFATSCAGGCVLLLANVALLWQVAQRGILVSGPGNWPAPFGISLVADLLSSLMSTITAVVGLCVIVYSLVDVDLRRQRFGFQPLVHVLLMGVSGAFLTGDIFNLYVWFEVMLMASFALLCLGGTRQQLEGAIKYVILNLLSSMLFLAAAGVLYGTVGTLNMADLARRLATTNSTSVTSVAGVMLLISFGIKAGLFPLFGWLPASYPTPPAAVSALLSGLLTKVGVYGLLRASSLLFAYEFTAARPLLLATAGATMVTGVLGAVSQVDFRRILSFHIISQIGYMLLGLALFTPLALAGTVFYLLHHIVVKTNLFLVSGIVARLEGTEHLPQLGGLYARRWWLAVLFLVPAFSLAGIPPLSGFWAKLLLARAALETEYYLLVAVSMVVGLLTLISMIKIWNEAFWKPAGHEETDKPPARLALMVAPVACLAAMTVAWGLAPQLLLGLAESTAQQLLRPEQYVRAVLPPADLVQALPVP